MDDRELIKRIMEEVKDEKLREELLALVVERNRKREEERPIDYVSRQEILFGATEGVAKVGWWIGYIISIVFMLVGSLGPLGLLAYFFTPAEERNIDHAAIGFWFSIPFIIGLIGFFSLSSGKKEYEKLKRKRENQGQS